MHFEAVLVYGVKPLIRCLLQCRKIFLLQKQITKCVVKPNPVLEKEDVLSYKIIWQNPSTVRFMYHSTNTTYSCIVFLWFIKMKNNFCICSKSDEYRCQLHFVCILSQRIEKKICAWQSRNDVNNYMTTNHSSKCNYYQHETTLMNHQHELSSFTRFRKLRCCLYLVFSFKDFPLAQRVCGKR